MLQGELSAILSTFIMLPFLIMIFVLSIFEWPFYTGFTVPINKRTKISVKAVLSHDSVPGSGIIPCIKIV